MILSRAEIEKREQIIQEVVDEIKNYELAGAVSVFREDVIRKHFEKEITDYVGLTKDLIIDQIIAEIKLRVAKFYHDKEIWIQIAFSDKVPHPVAILYSLDIDPDEFVEGVHYHVGKSGMTILYKDLDTYGNLTDSYIKLPIKEIKERLLKNFDVMYVMTYDYQRKKTNYQIVE